MYSITIITGRPGKWGKGQDLSEDQRNEAAELVFGLTLGDHSLQPDDVGVVELSNDWSLTQKLSLLLFPLAGSQRLYRYSDVHPSRHVQPTTTDFSKFTCQSKTACTRRGLNAPFSEEGFFLLSFPCGIKVSAELKEIVGKSIWKGENNFFLIIAMN